MNIKKIVVSALLLIILGLLGLMVSNIISKMGAKEKVKTGAKLPEFSFRTVDGEPFTHADVVSGKAILLMHFHPGCDDCEIETGQLIKEIDRFSEDQVLMVTAGNGHELEDFVRRHKLNDYNQITVLTHAGDDFYALFGSDVNPSFHIYNKDHELVKFFKGSVKMSLAKELMNP